MPRPRPPHLHKLTTRHGKVTWVVQVGRGAPKIRLHEPYGTAEFYEEYDAAVASSPKRATPKNRTTVGTLDWAWTLYRQSAAWSDLSQATRKQRENIMLNVLKNGNHSLSKITRAAIQGGIDRRRETPSAARNFLDTMRGMFKWLVEMDIVKHDATAGLTVKRRKSKGFPEWTYDEIIQYEKKWPLGTRERVMLDVYIYTGLRRGDAARVGPGHVRNDVISLATEKSQGDTMVHLPLLPVLKQTLAAGPTGKLSFIVNARGKPYVKESLGNAFKDACVAAGINGKSAHGLRKAAATRAAENGATVHELMAIFGWKNIRQAEVYTREADRKRLAAKAMSKLGT
jgi:integrase